MRTAVLALWAVAASAVLPPMGSPESPTFNWTEHYFENNVDHFSFSDSRTYRQRYLVADQYWDKAHCGPVFFYTGNEGPIDLFAENTGLMWSLAPKFGALLVFAEHRYYGKSLPFGDASFHPENIGLLSTDQALADYAVLLRQQLPAMGAACPVIAFGGSYGGMLAAWFRIKFPDVVAGAIAGSAPVLQFPGAAAPEQYSAITTRTFATSGPNGKTCTAAISQSWGVMAALGRTAAGQQRLQSLLGLCEPPADVEGELWPFVSAAWQYMAMADYPYPASFLGPMPAWPVAAACDKFAGVDVEGAYADPAPLLSAVRAAYNVFYNYTGQVGACFNASNAGPSTLGDPRPWNYQACTELILPVEQNSKFDMFYDMPWNLTAVTDACHAEYGVTPRPDWALTTFGGPRYDGASKIVFSNGELDPWSGGGVVNNVSLARDVVAVVIEDGAHHLDLRFPNPADPPSVLRARAIEVDYIAKWVKEWRN